MTEISGRGVCGGIAIGRVFCFRRGRQKVVRREVEDVSAELARFGEARRRAVAELRALFERALRDIGESGAQIFDIHAMMLEDEDYIASVENSIRIERVNAEYAVSLASEHFAAIFSDMNDAYMRARAADIRDISQRLIGILTGCEQGAAGEGTADRILCADDLAPSETMQLDRESIIAFVTSQGSVNSHTAILARAMGIPAVVGVGEDSGLDRLDDGTAIAVDGSSGRVWIEPDEDILATLRKKQAEEQRRKALLETYRGLDNITRDGRRVNVFANIQTVSEAGAALINDAGGIGLFRSEFLYLDRQAPPDEEEQFGAYRAVLQSMGDKKVVIRTLDIGADKQVDYLGLSGEENPAMGMRAIRICLTRPEIFRTQLRALLRASVYGRLAVMFPMITSVAEVNEILTQVSRIRHELTEEGKAVAETIELGIMIETPAAAVISDKLAPLVDFFSVGTNDLTQYTLALDRQNEAVARFFDPHHEAVMRLIAYAAQQAHRQGKWIGICGELAADLALTSRFLDMGIDELSVSPAFVLPLRAHIRSL